MTLLNYTKSEAVISIVSRRLLPWCGRRGCMDGSGEGCWSVGSDLVFELGGCYTNSLLKIIHFTPLFGVPFLYVCYLSYKGFRIM